MELSSIGMMTPVRGAGSKANGTLTDVSIYVPHFVSWLWSSSMLGAAVLAVPSPAMKKTRLGLSLGLVKYIQCPFLVVFLRLRLYRLYGHSDYVVRLMALQKKKQAIKS